MKPLHSMNSVVGLGRAVLQLSWVILLLAHVAWAQDMPISDVLIEGKAWEEVAQGYAFTDGAATDAQGNFYFADVTRGNSIYKIALYGTISTWANSATRISGLQFGPDGLLYACQGGQPGRIVAFDTRGEIKTIAADVQPNDLVVTSKGWIYFTETGKSQVTSIAPGGLPEKAGTGPLKPNGITLSPDEQSLVVSDYAGENIWVWQIDQTGHLRFSQPYMTMRLPAASQPSKGDGMTTDSAGRYYVTSSVGLQMFDPTGRMGGVILAPQSKPLVSVEFSGPELSYLYVCCGDKIYRRQTKAQGVSTKK